MKTNRSLFAVLFLLVCLEIPAQTLRFGDTRSRVVTDSIHSAILDSYRAYSVFLPDGYDNNSEKKYPVLYLLHGILNTNKGWYENGRVKSVMDQLTQSGDACEMIIVTPNAGGNIYEGVWNGYFNMPDWSYEDFFFNEFVPHIERVYRIRADKSHRAIGGLSMGGGGSTVYAQRHPDMFCACYAMSALMTVPAEGGLPSHGQSLMDIFNNSVREHSAIDFVTDAELLKNFVRLVGLWIVAMMTFCLMLISVSIRRCEPQIYLVNFVFTMVYITGSIGIWHFTGHCPFSVAHSIKNTIIC
jgi:poly(3-hydroxybutyrate) depolymerase